MESTDPSQVANELLNVTKSLCITLIEYAIIGEPRLSVKSQVIITLVSLTVVIGFSG
jgi:hypothetical protein